MPSVLFSPTPPSTPVIHLVGVPSSCAHAGAAHNMIAAHEARIDSVTFFNVRRISHSFSNVLGSRTRELHRPRAGGAAQTCKVLGSVAQTAPEERLLQDRRHGQIERVEEELEAAVGLRSEQQL